MNMINRTYGGNASGSVLRIAIGIPLLAILLLVSSAGAAPYAYVTNSFSDNVSVVDTAANNVTATISIENIPSGTTVNVGSRPQGVALGRAGTPTSTTPTVSIIANPATHDINVGTNFTFIASDEKGNIANGTYSVAVHENMPIPVILVHGLMEDSESTEWAETMKTMFTDQDFKVEIFNYEGVNQDIKTSAERLTEKIDHVKKTYNNSTQVDIVGHSEGGIVARTYINSDLYKKDVRKSVIIGSPNHGTVGDIVGKLIYYLKSGIAGRQMESHSPFLNWLNYGSTDLQRGPDRDDFKSVQYYTITSHTPLPLTITHDHFKVFIFDFIRYRFTPNGDSLTADNSLRLTGVPPLNDKDIIPNVWHSTPLPNILPDQVHSKDIINRAIYLIRENTPRSEANVASNIEQTPDNVAAQWSPPIQGTIKSDEMKTHTVFIDNTTEKAYFNLFWPGSDLDLVLYTPSGVKINSSVASNDPNINYTSEAIFESYEVRLPEPGNWTMEITAVNVTSTGENYSAITFMETNLFVGAGTDKESYVPNEPITVAAYVQYNGTPLSKVNVTASIFRSDGANSTIQLYDDGLHNDNQTDDGIYANVYTDTNIRGEYYITTSANGIIRNESFERKAFKNVWVELYPDLTITSSDIDFSNDVPILGENITINATIHNIGDADVNNASILFYDGDPTNASSILIAEDIINISTGQTARASSSWNATAGQHEIYVLISPFNDFLEKNYTNNKAYKIINITPTQSVRFTTDKAIYTQGEQVIFTLINNGTDIIDLPNAAPWWVENATTGEKIFSPIAAQVIIQFDPGKSKSWVWDQNDSEGKQVQQGTYRGGINSNIGVNYTKEFIVTAPLVTPTPTLSTQLPPNIVRVETFREGDMVFFSLFFMDPDNDAEGFGFRGANGSGWAAENHPFSSPSYGRVSPGRIEYPFNLNCETGPAHESDVESWIYDRASLISPPVTVHLACQLPTSTPQ